MPDPTPQPYAELATFGEELKREREIRGISLKEISAWKPSSGTTTRHFRLRFSRAGSCGSTRATSV
jgi:hypothetical protein